MTLGEVYELSCARYNRDPDRPILMYKDLVHAPRQAAGQAAAPGGADGAVAAQGAGGQAQGRRASPLPAFRTSRTEIQRRVGLASRSTAQCWKQGTTATCHANLANRWKSASPGLARQQRGLPVATLTRGTCGRRGGA
jgi:hypothetical protein